MKIKSIVLASAASAMIAMPAVAQDIKIGFVTTLTTPAALIGKQQKQGADLAMDHLGHKMAGKKVRILYADQPH